MSKRSADTSNAESNALKRGERPEEVENAGDVGDFEDEFEDDYESDDEVFEAGEDGQPDDENVMGTHKEKMDVDQATFIPGRTALAAGEVLSPDPSTYELLHSLSTPWPCLSFDFLPNPLGASTSTYPLTIYAVAGTQAEAGREKDNELMVMKLSGLSRMERDDDSSSSLDDEDDEDAEPILESKSIPLPTTTNRLRTFQSPPTSSATPPQTLTGTMLENGSIVIHDVTRHLHSFNTPGTVLTPAQAKPMATLTMHKSTEGYAIDWAPPSLHPLGRLLTGDNSGQIYLTHRADTGEWKTDPRPFLGHASSVEELQWSPSERNVFASASADGTVKIWDTRSKSHTPKLSVQASSTDVNVMSWSRTTPHLLATGADDGVWAVWDLRQWRPSSSSSSGSSSAPNGRTASTPIATFDFHRAPITSIEWHPSDDSTLLVGCADNTVSLWDLAVELDDEESRDTQGVPDVPPQLLFVHYMDSVKEAHWYGAKPGTVMGTGAAGFSVFKTISV
ncbi:MAG: ribosome biosynthesis protein rrb1 [Vezdaea acicularis]|nr:MAG: ribosome biosynthesis protein rrb1 [Vezdaea acicularis]